MLRFVKNQFNSDQVTTVGAAFLQCPVPQEDSDDKIQFGIWDTAGSERFKALAPMYYRGAEAAIVVYDVTSFESFEGAKSWVRELKLNGQPNVVIALAANKGDLEQCPAHVHMCTCIPVTCTQHRMHPPRAPPRPGAHPRATALGRRLSLYPRCPSSAPAPPPGTPGGTGRPGTPRGETGPLGAWPRPRLLRSAL